MFRELNNVTLEKLPPKLIRQTHSSWPAHGELNHYISFFVWNSCRSTAVLTATVSNNQAPFIEWDMVEHGYNALCSMRMELECSAEEIHCKFKETRQLFANNEMHKPLLMNSRAQGVSGKNKRPSQTLWRDLMLMHPLHRLASPVGPHAMIEVSILPSVINDMGRNAASMFCH